MHGDGHAACRLPEDGDALGVSAEELDVVVHPLERHHLGGRCFMRRLGDYTDGFIYLAND